MTYTRIVNVVTLSLLLILTGCFGLGQDDGGIIEEAEAEGEGNTVPETAAVSNYPPVVEGNTLLGMFGPVSESVMFINDGNSCEGILFHGAVDLDGDNMTLGWDTNLDGSVDQILTSNSGTTEMSIPTSEFTVVLDLLYMKIALIATDSNGAKGVDLVDVLCEVQNEEDEDSGTLDTYVWSATDGASGDTTNATNEILVRVQMDGGQELNWGVVEVSITVNGESPRVCGTDGTAPGCSYDKYEGSGDTAVWSVGEGIIISEGSEDICDGEGACFVAVSIVEKGAGNADDKVIGAVSASA